MMNTFVVIHYIIVMNVLSSCNKAYTIKNGIINKFTIPKKLVDIIMSLGEFKNNL